MKKIKEFLKKWNMAVSFAVGVLATIGFAFHPNLEVCCLPVLVVSFLFEIGVATNYCEKPNIRRYLITILGALLVQGAVLLIDGGNEDDGHIESIEIVE